MSGILENRKYLLRLIFLLTSLFRLCDSNIQIYRYVDDDTDNFISSDDYFAKLFPSTTTTLRPHHHTHYPVYSRPTLQNLVIDIENKQSDQATTASFKPTTTTEQAPVTTTTTITKNNNYGIVNSEQFFESPPSAEAFLTKGENTEETIPLLGQNMKESIIKDIIISKSMIRNGSEFNHVVLLCNASYPVEWIYIGVGAPMLYTTQIRTFGNFFDPRTYGHSSIVVLVQDRLDERQTGTYMCVGIDKPQLQTGFHLYFKGEFGFPSLQSVVVQPETRESIVSLPCPTTDPSATIGLYKLTSLKESGNFSLSDSFSYDPRSGFYLKLSDISNPYGTYICKFNDLESDWKIQLVKPKYDEVQVIPNATIIQIGNLVDHKFICKAKEPIQIMLPNTVDFGRVEYRENFDEKFPFQAQLTITPSIPLFSVANYFKINCQSKQTRRVLHTWEYSSFGSEVISVRYDKHHKRLLCCSKSGLTPIHEMAKCETVTDCQIKQHCFKSGRCDYAFPPFRVDAPRGCTGIEFMDDFPSHVMRCSVGQFSQTMFVTSNIANDNLIIYDNEVPDTEEILQIVYMKMLKNNPEIIEVRCVASIFFFSTNIVFAFEHENGTLTFANEALVHNVNSYGPTLNAVLPSETKRIICFAPLTRSSEWRNVSLDISDVSSFRPANFVRSRGQKHVGQQQFQASGDKEIYKRNSLNGRIVKSVKSSTSVKTFLKNQQGRLIRVMQDI